MSTQKVKIVLLYLVTLTVVICVLNAYPIEAARRLAISSKRMDLIGKANMVAGTIAKSPELSRKEITSVVDMLGIGREVRIIVTDRTGLVIFDSSEFNSQVGNYLVLREVMEALFGQEAFHCTYENMEFESRAAVTYLRNGNTSGVVYFYEVDKSQASTLRRAEEDARNLSIMVAVIATLFATAFAWRFGQKTSRLLDGIRLFRGGDYNYRMSVKGSDELTDIAIEFNSLANRLQKTEDKRRLFVSNASHELRTPLASIKLLVDSIIQTESIKIEQIRDFLGDIREEIERLTRITDDLLVLTKQDSEAVPKSDTPDADLSEIIRRAADMLAPLAQSRNISLVVESEENVLISANSDGLYQLVFNLMENAVKYNVDGGTVMVMMTKKDKKVTFSVEDTGIGIPNEDLPKIFDRFYRVDKARSRETGGTGLGLSIAKGWVDSYGGHIEVESALGKGTRFVVRFPLTGGEID